MKRNKLLLMMLLLVSFLASNLSFGAIPASERQALIDLYNSTNGDSWTNETGWKTPPLHIDRFAVPGTEVSWSGITVSENYATRIKSIGNNLINNRRLYSNKKLYRTKNCLLPTILNLTFTG